MHTLKRQPASLKGHETMRAGQFSFRCDSSSSRTTLGESHWLGHVIGNRPHLLWCTYPSNPTNRNALASYSLSIVIKHHFLKKKFPPQCARPPLDGTPSLESPADSIQINRINPSDSSTSYSTIIIRIAMTRPAAARWHCRSGMRQLDPISNSVMILCFRRANESYARRQVLQEPR